jgi:uroporphyrinogen decarboxylase
MKREPDFERLRTALFCGVPDAVPTAELKCEDYIKGLFLGAPMPSLSSDPRGYFERDIEFHSQAGYDYVRVAPMVEYGDHWASAKHSYAAGSPQVSERKWALTGEGLIRTEDDFDRYPWPDAAEATYEWLEIAAALLPPKMRLGTSLKGGGIFERAWMLMGFEAFSFAVLDRPDLVARLIDQVGQTYYEFLRTAFEYDRVELVWLGDDQAYYTGLMVSPDFLREHVYPWYERIAELCRSYSPQKAFVFHSDGNLWEVIEDLVATGITALHPVEPKAMDIVQVKRALAGRVSVIGNIDLGYTLTRGTPEEVRAEVAERIRTCAPGGGYVVSSANSVTEYVPLENYRAMLDAVEEFGTYPIAG